MRQSVTFQIKTNDVNHSDYHKCLCIIKSISDLLEENIIIEYKVKIQSNHNKIYVDMIYPYHKRIGDIQQLQHYITNDFLYTYPSLLNINNNNITNKNHSAISYLPLFIAGTHANIGKSTICIGILGNLLSIGYKPEDLGYIKPATQCECDQLVHHYCHANKINFCRISPLRFYKGFTREYLDKDTNNNYNKYILNKIKNKCDEIGKNKKILLIDGVGYPSVGSICNVSNATIAYELNAPCIIIGKNGVGDAVDTFNLDENYFINQKVKVLGVIFNKFDYDGYYSIDLCKKYISMYFSNNKSNINVYGFLPKIDKAINFKIESNGIDNPNKNEKQIIETKGDILSYLSSIHSMSIHPYHLTELEKEIINLIIKTFHENVNIFKIIKDLTNYHHMNNINK